MSTTRKTADQVTAEGGGRIDTGKFDSFSETEIERMAQEDGEEEFSARPQACRRSATARGT